MSWDSVISQPRIVVLGLSQLYVFIELAYRLLVVVVLGFKLTYDLSCDLNPVRNCI